MSEKNDFSIVVITSIVVEELCRLRCICKNTYIELYSRIKKMCSFKMLHFTIRIANTQIIMYLGRFIRKSKNKSDKNINTRRSIHYYAGKINNKQTKNIYMFSKYVA